MITFKLEDADAVALVSVIGALHFEPSFLAALKEQLAVQQAPAEVVEEAPVKKTKKSAEGDK